MKSPQLSLAIPMVLLPTLFFGQSPVAETVSKRVQLDDIEHIQLLGHHTLTVRQGDEEYVDVTTDSDDIKKIEAKIQGSKLSLGKVNIHYGWSFGDDEPNHDIDAHFEVQVKNLKSISNMGVGKIEVINIRTDEDLIVSNMGAGSLDIRSLTADEIEFSNFGAGKIEAVEVKAEQMSEKSVGAGKSSYANVIADEIELNTVGGASITFTGFNTVDEVDIKAVGASTINAESLRARKARIESAGASTVYISVTEDLDVDVHGNGKVIYSGEPSIKKSIKGTGSVSSSGK